MMLCDASIAGKASSIRDRQPTAKPLRCSLACKSIVDDASRWIEPSPATDRTITKLCFRSAPKRKRSPAGIAHISKHRRRYAPASMTMLQPSSEMLHHETTMLGEQSMLARTNIESGPSAVFLRYMVTHEESTPNGTAHRKRLLFSDGFSARSITRTCTGAHTWITLPGTALSGCGRGGSPFRPESHFEIVRESVPRPRRARPRCC